MKVLVGTLGGEADIVLNESMRECQALEKLESTINGSCNAAKHTAYTGLVRNVAQWAITCQAETNSLRSRSPCRQSFPIVEVTPEAMRANMCWLM